MTTNHIQIGNFVKIDSNPIYGTIHAIHENTVFIKNRWKDDYLGRDYDKKMISPSKFKIGDYVKISEPIYGYIHAIHKNTVFIKNRLKVGHSGTGRDYPKQWIV
jgi:hypothetical protein